MYNEIEKEFAKIDELLGDTDLMLKMEKIEDEREEKLMKKRRLSLQHWNWSEVVNVSSDDEVSTEGGDTKDSAESPAPAPAGAPVDPPAPPNSPLSPLSPAPVTIGFKVPRVIIRSRNRLLRLRDEEDEDVFMYFKSQVLPQNDVSPEVNVPPEVDVPPQVVPTNPENDS